MYIEKLFFNPGDERNPREDYQNESDALDEINDKKWGRYKLLYVNNLQNGYIYETIYSDIESFKRMVVNHAPLDLFKIIQDVVYKLYLDTEKNLEYVTDSEEDLMDMGLKILKNFTQKGVVDFRYDAFTDKGLRIGEGRLVLTTRRENI